MVIALIEVLVINLLEYALTSHTVLYLYNGIIQRGKTVISILLPTYCNTLLRDFALMIFVGLVADNIKLSEKQIENDQELLRSKNQLVVKSQGKTTVIDIDPIYLCRQEKNYAILYSVDGQKFKKRISLKDLEDLLRTKQFIRISKSDIIKLPFIKRCEDNILILKDKVISNTKAVSIGKSFMETAIPVILQFLKNDLESNSIQECAMPETAQTLIPTTIIQNLNPKATKIQQYVSSHNECKLDDVVSGTSIPKSTVSRYLKELQQNGLIEYVGSKKTGGYRVVGQEN